MWGGRREIEREGEEREGGMKERKKERGKEREGCNGGNKRIIIMITSIETLKQCVNGQPCSHRETCASLAWGHHLLSADNVLGKPGQRQVRKGGREVGSE